MTHLQLALSLSVGGLVGLGVVALVVAMVPAVPDLATTLDRLDGRSLDRSAQRLPAVAEGAPRLERAGAWLATHLPYGPTSAQMTALRLKGMSIAQFFAEKLILALVCAAVPSLVGTVFTMGLHTPVWVPAGAAMVGVVIGWFLPDLQLRGSVGRARADAGEALFTFFDLVTLERLANLSGTQALHSAASLSDATLFVSIRAALERARLEQQPPYHELKRLADELRLPELADIADVMRLDETGAALSGALRARVKELRDAHLTQAKIDANAVSERMTIFMVVPALVFGLIFLVPPLLRLVAG